MSEPKQTVTVPPTGLGSIAFWSDLGRGLYYACAGAILRLVSFVGGSVLSEHPHFPNTWAEWFPYVQGIAFAASGYVLAKFGINNVGQIMQRDKPVVLVGKEHLEDLTQQAANSK